MACGISLQTDEADSQMIQDAAVTSKTTPSSVVIYYRQSMQEPSWSDLAMIEQREAVIEWLSTHPSTIVGEYTECEPAATARPALKRAIDACRQARAILLVARTVSIGSGRPFYPRIASVDICFAANPVWAIGSILPCPAAAPPGFSLCFSVGSGSRRVLLCNKTDAPLRDARLIISALTSKSTWCPPPPLTESDRHATNAPSLAISPSLHINRLPTKMAVVAYDYDPMVDGDHLTGFALTHSGTVSFAQHHRAIIGIGGPQSSFVSLN